MAEGIRAELELQAARRVVTIARAYREWMFGGSVGVPDKMELIDAVDAYDELMGQAGDEKVVEDTGRQTDSKWSQVIGRASPLWSWQWLFPMCVIGIALLAATRHVTDHWME